jgi:hypothetical protein
MSSKKTSISNGETKNHLPPIPARVSGELGGGGKNGDYVKFLLVGNGGCARGYSLALLGSTSKPSTWEGRSHRRTCCGVGTNTAPGG